MPVDGANRRMVVNEDWAATTRLDSSADQETVWQAVLCHTTQLPAYSRLEQIPEKYRQAIWRDCTYHRVFSLVNRGRAIERDLFVGLR